MTPGLAQLQPEIAPLVRRIDAAPRERIVPLLSDQLRAGTPYRQLLAAAFLTAIGRGGHHSVYLLHAAHQLSLDAQRRDRHLPLFWALDVIKEHLTRFDYAPVPPLKGPLPTPESAAGEFDLAMEAGERERAERALVALLRSRGPGPTRERLWAYAGRDWSFIGHLAILVANSVRTLDTIGWQHAEPVLRYVVAEQHKWADGKLDGQPYATNRERARRLLPNLPANWSAAGGDSAATLELLPVLRHGDWRPACEAAAECLSKDAVPAGAVWDAVHLAAGEFMIRFTVGGRRINNRALHSNTATNALHYAFRHCVGGETRLLLLLQAVAWVTDFMRIEAGRDMLRDLSITEIPAEPLPPTPEAAVEEIFSLLPPRHFGQENLEHRADQDRASRLAFALGAEHPRSPLFLRAARAYTARKATLNAHDYKFPVAIFEDLNQVSRGWRPHLMAASIHYLHGEQMEDNALFQQVGRRAAGDG